MRRVSATSSNQNDTERFAEICTNNNKNDDNNHSLPVFHATCTATIHSSHLCPVRWQPTNHRAWTLIHRGSRQYYRKLLWRRHSVNVKQNRENKKNQIREVDNGNPFKDEGFGFSCLFRRRSMYLTSCHWWKIKAHTLSLLFLAMTKKRHQIYIEWDFRVKKAICWVYMFVSEPTLFTLFCEDAVWNAIALTRLLKFS